MKLERFLACLTFLIGTAHATGEDVPIRLGHFRPAAANVEARFTCEDGEHRAVARHTTELDQGMSRHRVVTLEASRPLIDDELAQVNALLQDQFITGISAGCLNGSVQFVINTWSPTAAAAGAVMVTISQDGRFKLL